MHDADEDGQIRKILVIEDDRDYRNLLKTYLTKHIQDVQIIEYDPVSKGAPPEDFDWTPYDILILDYYLCIYGLTGLDLLQKHRKKPGFPATLMITGAGDEEVAVNALNFGVYEFLRKEKLTRQGLIESVNDAFKKHKGVQEKSREQEKISHAFDKTLFYRELEHPSGTDSSKIRALVLVDVDEMDKLTLAHGYIVHDNLLRHLARLSYEKLSTVYNELYITRLTDTSVAILIKAPDKKDNLEKELTGLSNHFKGNTYLFGDKPVDCTVSIGAVLIDQENTTVDFLIKAATYACDVARRTSGNSSHFLLLEEYKEKERQHQEEEQRKLELEKQRQQEEQQRQEQEEKHRKEERQRLEAERQQLAEEKRRLEDEERKRLDELKQREEEEKRKEEEEKRKIEEERKQLEEERQKLAEEKRKLEEEEQKRRMELQQREADEKRKEEEERQKLEAERKRLEEERLRIAEEKRKLEDAEKKRIEELHKREEEEKRKEEEERQKLDAERLRIAEEKRKLQEEGKKRIEEVQKREAEEKRKEQEKQRKLEVERQRLEKERRQLEEEKRRQAEEQERLRIIQAEKKRKAEEERLRQLELEKKRKAEEARRKAEEEQKQREEQRRLLEEKKEKLRLAEEERKRKEEKLRKLEEENKKAEEKRRHEKEARRKAEELRRKKEEEKIQLAKKEKQLAKTSVDNDGKAPSDDDILSFPLDVSVPPEAGMSVDQLPKKVTDEKKQKEDKKNIKEEPRAEQKALEATGKNEVVVNESELDTHALAIKKAFNENRAVQTFQPVVAMFSPGSGNETALFKVSAQVVYSDGSITTGDEIRKQNTAFSLQQFIDRWLLRETVGRIVNNSDLQSGKIFIITISEAWLKDITLFNWLKDLLAGLENIRPAKSIALEIPAFLLIEHSKRALPLINALKKSYGFRIALGDIKSVDQVSKLFNVLDFNLFIINSTHAEELSIKGDENGIEVMKKRGGRLVVDGIEDATMMTNAISHGADYVMGSFIGGPETIIAGTGQVESLDIIYNAF